MSPDDVLAALDPDQRAVAHTPLGPMCVLAGAGTGKTRAITHRIAYGVTSGAYPPNRVLAVTFTARAAGEMRTRLRELGVGGVQASTFHAAALRQLRYFWPRAVGGPPPDLARHKAALVAETGNRLRLQFDRAAVRDLAAEIEWAKSGMLLADEYVPAARAARRDPAGVDLSTVARLLTAYEDVKSDRGVIDFEDVLLLTVGVLAEREDIAREVRDRYQVFVVDEYQDVNTVQQRLLDLWAGDRDDICVVGDPAQTIYSFAGASPRHLRDFPRRHPGSEIVRLTRNYRSSPQVIGLANAVLAGAEGGLTGDQLGVDGHPGAAPSGGGQVGSRGTRSGYGLPGLVLRAHSEPGPQPTLTSYPDDEAEAAGIAGTIRALVSGGRAPQDIAVLFRTNAQSEALEHALAEAGLPYLVRGGERFFDRQEVRAAVLLLRGQARADDGSRPLGELTRDVIAAAGWTPEPPSSGGATRERWESLTALTRVADDLARTTPEARLPQLVRELDERAAAQHAPTVNGVTLASLHAAKGLEWDVVLLAGCSDGYLPIAMAGTPEQIEEERRLLYVGVTRARRELRLSWAAARAPGGKATRRPSRFLAGAAAILGHDVRRPAPRSRRAPKSPAGPPTCRRCGTVLDTAATRKVGRCDDCPPTYDEAVFESLRQWRITTARAGSVPAYVVFTDATLTAIAEARPSTLGDLAKISGVGAAKLERYGADVLAILGGTRRATPAPVVPGAVADNELSGGD